MQSSPFDIITLHMDQTSSTMDGDSTNTTSSNRREKRLKLYKRDAGSQYLKRIDEDTAMHSAGEDSRGSYRLGISQLSNQINQIGKTVSESDTSAYENVREVSNDLVQNFNYSPFSTSSITPRMLQDDIQETTDKTKSKITHVRSWSQSRTVNNSVSNNRTIIDPETNDIPSMSSHTHSTSTTDRESDCSTNHSEQQTSEGNQNTGKPSKHRLSRIRRKFISTKTSPQNENNILNDYTTNNGIGSSHTSQSPENSRKLETNTTCLFVVQSPTSQENELPQKYRSIKSAWTISDPFALQPKLTPEMGRVRWKKIKQQQDAITQVSESNIATDMALPGSTTASSQEITPSRQTSDESSCVSSPRKCEQNTKTDRIASPDTMDHFATRVALTLPLEDCSSQCSTKHSSSKASDTAKNHLIWNNSTSPDKDIRDISVSPQEDQRTPRSSNTSYHINPDIEIPYFHLSPKCTDILLRPKEGESYSKLASTFNSAIDPNDLNKLQTVEEYKLSTQVVEISRSVSPTISEGFSHYSGSTIESIQETPNCICLRRICESIINFFFSPRHAN